MQSWFTIELDGETCRVDNESARQTLAQFLSTLDPVYSHYEGGNPWQGGAPVIFAETTGPAPRFRSVDSHLLMLPMLADQVIWTPEGIVALDGEHPAVKALGIGHIECCESRRMAILALLFEGYYRPDLRKVGQIKEQFDAVISRTANPFAIREAGSGLFASAETLRHEASQRSARSGQQNEIWTGKKDIFGDRFTRVLHLKKPVDNLDYVDRNKHRFHRPNHLADLQRLIDDYPDARLVAGGTSVLDSDSTTDQLISVEGVSEFQVIHSRQDYWEIGAGVNLTRVGEAIGSEYPSFLKALTKFASRPVRNRATLGGYLAVASDSGQLSPLLVAMDARVVMASREGEREAPVYQFFEGNGRTILGPGEFIQSILIPRGNESALANRGLTSRITDLYSVGPRRSLCEGWVTGGFAIELREKTVAKAWICYNGVADRPVRARHAEEALAGNVWSEATMVSALAPLYQEVNVTRKKVGRASAEYRKQLVMTLFQKFFYQHPTPLSIRPVEQGITREFALDDQPFFDSIA